MKVLKKAKTWWKDLTKRQKQILGIMAIWWLLTLAIGWGDYRWLAINLTSATVSFGIGIFLSTLD